MSTDKSCARCGVTTVPITIRGYRMVIKGDSLGGPFVSTTSCPECGLISFWDPRAGKRG